MKLLRKINLLILGISLLASCEAGLEYEEVPASIYKEVGITTAMFNVKARELFKNQIIAINYDGGRWVENDISTVLIGNGEYEWENVTADPITVNGTVVAPGKKIKLSGKITEEANANAPGGKLYVVEILAVNNVVHSTKGNGFLFDASKFSGNFKLLGPVDNRAQRVILPAKKNELIVEMNLVQVYNCMVYPQDGAPQLGAPGDFSKPARYLVVNESRLPDGVERAQRLYELRITFLDLGLL